MAEPIIGERIRALRKPAYTQNDLAAAAAVSVDVIRKLEQGRRHTASIGTLQRIARALDVDLAELLGPSRPVPATGADQARVGAIRDVLTSVDDLLGELDGADAPDLTAQVHQITASILLRLGAPDLGYVAAREALRLAALASDPLRAAAARYTLGHVLIRQGRFVDAERVSVATAEGMQPSGDASTAHLSVYGGVLLRGATAAARQGRAGAATDLLAEAAAAAQRTGVDRTDYDVVFGPSNVVMQSTDCSVVAEDYVVAAEVARTMPHDSALPLVSRSRHLVDVAHAQLRLGHDRAAESALLTMERAAPEWTAHHQLPRVLVGELLTRGRPSVRLRELAHRLNTTRAPLSS